MLQIGNENVSDAFQTVAALRQPKLRRAKMQRCGGFCLSSPNLGLVGCKRGWNFLKGNL